MRDEVRAAKAANKIAKCHLEPIFIPKSFLKVSLEDTCELDHLEHSVYRSGSELRKHTLEAIPENKKEVVSKRRVVSLNVAQQVMLFSLDVSVDSCKPLLLIDSYLVMAELRLMQGKLC